MSRIHPTNNRCQDLCIKGRRRDDDDDGGGGSGSSNPPCPAAAVVVLTVWKRSSMTFQGTDGFTVFDGNGGLAFRVDNYSRKKGLLKGGLVLMDGAGKALLTLKPQEQILSRQCQWNGYNGEEGGCGKKGLNNSSNLLFSMRRSSGKDEAEVFMGGERKQRTTTTTTTTMTTTITTTPDYRIEGSFRRRNCKITSGVNGEILVAKIDRKKVNQTVVLGEDVFSLLVMPGFDSQLIMGFVMILDRICVNKPFFTPFLCS